MEAILLGTAAAEGVPGLFCACERCRAARVAGGRDIRGRSALFLPPDVLIDLGPDALGTAQRLGLDWSQLSALLYTHSHDDHFLPNQLGYLRPPFAHNNTLPLGVYANAAVRAGIGDGPPEIDLHSAVPFQPIRLPNGAATPIRSHHRTEEETLNYVITRGGKSLLYACDLGSYDEETWAWLAEQRLDGVIMECTFGTEARDAAWPYHMGMPDTADYRDRLVKQGTLAPSTPFVLTHFSHNGVLPFNELQREADKYNLTIGYDGMRLTL